MAKFAWKEGYKGMKYRKDKYKDICDAVWVVVHGHTAQIAL